MSSHCGEDSRRSRWADGLVGVPSLRDLRVNEEKCSQNSFAESSLARLIYFAVLQLYRALFAR